MPRKKILFVIVEGPSDDAALSVLLSRFFDSNVVHVHVMHCDITTELGVTPNNIVRTIGDCVKKFAGRLYKSGDFCQIIHIVDMDGAFIPNNAVVEDASAAKPIYSITEIRTRQKSGIENRNLRKRENLNRLLSTPEIWKIPYRVYYMSCNLDHALYGKLNSTDDNTCHKRKARSLVIWNCHIDKDCELNNRHKDDRKGDRLKHDHNNDKDCKD